MVLTLLLTTLSLICLGYLCSYLISFKPQIYFQLLCFVFGGWVRSIIVMETKNDLLFPLKVDLDLGNYERFLDIKLTRDNNITTGKIYQVY